MSSEQGADEAGIITALRRVSGPRPAVLAVVAVGVLGAVLVLAQLVLSAQSSSRSSARDRFANGAVVRGQLTSALLSTSGASLRATGAKLAPTPGALAKLSAASHLGYAALLSGDGRLLAVSAGAPPAVAKRLAARPAYVRQAASGRSWISGVIPAAHGGPTLDWAIPFPSAHGRRILVEGIHASTLTPFLTSFLSQGSSGRAIYVVDSGRRLIAASKTAKVSNGRLPAQLAAAPDLSRRTIDGSYVASAAIAGTGWRIVLAQPTEALYPEIAGARSWFLWVAVLLAAAIGILSLVLLRRSQVRSAQLVAAHRELRALNESLEHKVAERTELAEARAHALSRSNAELEQFASVAAHDLQEPLRKIRMYCERVERRRDDVPEDVGADITRMDAAAGRMQNLIGDLLDLARVNSRGRELVAIDLTAIAEEVVGDLEGRIDELGASVEIGQLPTVLGDRVQLRQVIQNLLSNALKFQRQGATPNVRISSEELAGGRCAVTVSDNGIGFDDKYAERIFGTFQRLHGRGEYEGTGIGLSIARKIAWRHEGDIRAHGVLGEGATFTLTLRLARTTDVSELPVPASPQTERAAA